MNHLRDICSGGSDLQSLTLDELRRRCQSAGQAFGLSSAEVVLLIVVVLVAFFWLLAARQRANEHTGTVVGNTVEGVAYAAIGMVAGSGFGLFAAEIVPPRLLGIILVLVAAVAGFFAIYGAATGDGDAGPRVAAVVLGVLLAAGVATMGVLGLAVSGGAGAAGGYEHYLNAVAIGLGLLGALDGIVSALLRGPHWAAGWALVFLNSSWGFLGNILGLGTHLGSYLCWANDGAVERRNRKAYTLYRRGLTLRNQPGNRYAFTQGWVMSCDSPGALEAHEAIHVTQHFALGPIYVVSHGIWDLVGAGIGAVAGLANGLGAGEGVTRMSYFNNPYEIMAYASHNGARQDSDKLVIPSPWSYVFMVAWIGAAVVIAIVLAAHWAV